MELRERYDPEDIETLLIERGFDDLLEEERAYVLRHLSGRDEYESMRTLLLHMRDQPPREESGPADPRVRTAVIDAFRSRREPRMTIWLNSIGAALWPKEASAMWRPALTLASIALLLVGGWWFVQRADLTMANELAELKQEHAKDEHVPAPSSAATAEQSAPAELDNMANVQEQATRTSGLEDAGYPAREQREEAVERLSATTVDGNAEKFAPPPPVAVDIAFDGETSADRKDEIATATLAEPAPSVPGSGRTVTAEDMARNYSITNSSTEAVLKETRAKATKALTGGRNLADDEVLLSLLNTGW